MNRYNKELNSIPYDYICLLKSSSKCKSIGNFTKQPNELPKKMQENQYLMLISNGKQNFIWQNYQIA